MISLLNKCTYFYAGVSFMKHTWFMCFSRDSRPVRQKTPSTCGRKRFWELPIDWVIWIRFYNIQYRPIGLDRYQHLCDFRDS